MPPILDVAIGTVFVFLLFSLIVSALNEIILSYLEKRADFLELGLRELMGLLEKKAPQSGMARLWERIKGAVEWALTLVRNFFRTPAQPDTPDRVRLLLDHGLLNSLSRSQDSNRPSYIPAGAFVITLLDLIVRGKLAEANAAATAEPIDLTTGPIPDKLREAIQKLPEGKLRESLTALLNTAGTDLDAFKQAIEAWFNDSMDRVSGWYKRYAQRTLFVLAFVLAAILNVDTVRVVRELSTNPNLAKAIAAQAENFAKSGESSLTDEEAKREQEEAKQAVDHAHSELQEATASNDESRISTAQKALARARAVYANAKFRTAVATLSNSGIPMGWDQDHRPQFAASFEWQKLFLGIAVPYPKSVDWLVVAETVLGWFLTALAASLGAPFWFDVLGRVVNVRNAGRVPGAADPTGKAPAASLETTPTGT